LNKYQFLNGNALDKLRELPDNLVQCVTTSPPYWQLRDYFSPDQLGHEDTPDEYIEKLVAIFAELKRVLRDDGVLWVNIGDTYSTVKKGYTNTFHQAEEASDILSSMGIDKKTPDGMKSKNLLFIPTRFAMAMQRDGWIVRSEVIWDKANAMPDGAKDRPTRSHEYLYQFSMKQKYFWDYNNMQEDSVSTHGNIMRFGSRKQKGTNRHDQDRSFENYGKRNKRSVWRTSVSSYNGGHFATYPPELIEPAIIASTSEKGCCPTCRTPWGRTLVKEKKEDNSKKGYELILVDKGWTPGCKCGEEKTNKCIVLDPFSGVATTGLVALNNNLDYIGIEINKEYIEESKKRLGLVEEQVFPEESHQEYDFRNGG
jgi:DNA modification methylase